MEKGKPHQTIRFSKMEQTPNVDPNKGYLSIAMFYGYHYRATI